MAEKETKEKALDKMTVKELREIAKEIPDITGVHGMNKAELIDAVNKVKGIAEAPKEKAETPKEKAETPKEKTETPKEKAEAPKEKAEAPKEKAEAPKEKVEAPKEKVETPKEKKEAPKEKAETKKEKTETPKKKAETPEKTVETPKKIKGVFVKDIKSKIRSFKAERKAALEAKDKKMATIYRRRISRLKKKSRKAA
jgi:Rho termination factor-like protein